MMGLAKAGWGEGGAIHPAILAGFDSGRDRYGWKWQAPVSTPPAPKSKQNEGNGSPPLGDLMKSTDWEEVNQLPLWLQKFDNPPPTPSNPDTQAKEVTHSRSGRSVPKVSGLGNIYAKQRTHDTKKDIPQKFERLDACTSVDDFRIAAVKLDVDILSRLAFSKSAFRRVLEIGCSLETVLQFLSDPSLNIQGAGNVQSLWEWFIDEPRNGNDSSQLHKWLRKHVSLGMLSKDELHDLVEVALHSSDVSPGTRRNMDLCQTMLDALNSSLVYQVTDLDSGMLNRLLQLAFCDHSWRNPELQSLSLHLLEKCEPTQIQNMVEGISSLLTSYIVSTCPDEKINIKEGKVSKLLNCLTQGSETQASRAIAFASHMILKRLRQSTSTCALIMRNISIWWSLLRHHQKFECIKDKPEWLRIERALTHEMEILCSYMRHLSDDEKCVFLLRHWFTKNVDDGDSHRPGTVIGSSKLFQNGLINRKANECPFVLLFRFLGPRVSAFRSLLPRLFSLLNKLEMYETTLALFSHFQQSKTSVDLPALAQKIINCTSTNPQVACTLFKIVPSLPLESCPVVAEMMIHNPAESPGAPLGFLALRQESLGVSRVYPRTGQEICRAQIELLNRMALAYAHAAHLYPRVALRQVYQCYHILLRRHWRRSIGVDISRALTVAGVVRPLEESQLVNTTQLNFILNIVREVEGDEIASKVDELVYAWHDDLIRQNAEKAVERRLRRSLHIHPLEAEEETTPGERKTEPTRIGVQEAGAPWIVGGQSWGKLPGETNAEELLRVRGARDLAYARASQIAAMKERGIVYEDLMQSIQIMGEDSIYAPRNLRPIFTDGGRLGPVRIASAGWGVMQTNPGLDGASQGGSRYSHRQDSASGSLDPVCIRVAAEASMQVHRGGPNEESQDFRLCSVNASTTPVCVAGAEEACLRVDQGPVDELPAESQDFRLHSVDASNAPVCVAGAEEAWTQVNQGIVEHSPEESQNFPP